MAKDYQEIDERIQRWVEAQRMFFVSTAPRADDGLINCSPKGLDGLRILGPKQMVYADIGGSGIETVAHLKENARITIMLCALSGPPKIFRFYGKGRCVEPHEEGFADFVELFPNMPTIRNFVVIEIQRIRDSCGYGVPLYEFNGERESMRNYVTAKTEDEIVQRRIENNEKSLDGLDGLNIEAMRQTS
jgi:hypothetical protein